MAEEDLRRGHLRGGAPAQRAHVGEVLREPGDVAAGAGGAAVAALVERPDRAAPGSQPLRDVRVAPAVIAEAVEEEDQRARRGGRLDAAEGESGTIRRRPELDVAEPGHQATPATTRRR